jgi:ADP-dependent NAD(P)H-hydrate dehydratase / NAD(P)H-hydrate epimerase
MRFNYLCSTRIDAMKLVTVDQMRSIEAASDAQGHTYAAMMECAGSAVARVATSRIIQTRLDIHGQRILVLVGPGNNGGDGLVAARHLHDAGADIGVFVVKPRDDEHVAALRERGINVSPWTDHRLREWLDSCVVIVDALLGTGTARPISGDLADLLQVVKGAVSDRRWAVPDLIDPAWPASLQGAFSPSALPRIARTGRATKQSPTIDAAIASPPTLAMTFPLVVAVDGPTGLNYDTGEIDPLTLPADISVTFAYPKIGHTRFPGADHCGELIIADIGTDPQLAQAIDRELADPALIRSLLPARPRDAHKGTFGKVLIVSGSTLYTGAPVLAAEAAYRAGAGLVTLATPQSIHAIMASKINEATFLPLPDRDGALNAEAFDHVRDAIKDYTATLIGPGLTTKAKSFIEQLLAQRAGQSAVVFDADALNILAQIDQWWTRVPPHSILTPHPGEMTRLTGLSMKELEADRERVAIEFARRWGHVVLLKGAFTVIAAPDDRTILLPFANPALATAGSGDVLAGTIAALRAQGLPSFEAALCGGYLHGAAGELARQEIAAAGVLAGDLLSRLPRVLATLFNAHKTKPRSLSKPGQA